MLVGLRGASNVSCYADTIVLDVDVYPGRLVLASFGGPEQAVNAVVAAILSRRDGVHVLNGAFRMPRLEEGYRAFVSHADDVTHAVVVSGAATGAFGPPVLIGWGGDLDAALEAALRRDFGVPFLPEWVPWLRKEMEREGYLRRLTVWGETPHAFARFREEVTDETMLQFIRRGLRTGEIGVPDGQPAEGDWRSASGVAGYLARFAPTLGRKVEAMVRPRRKAGTKETSPETRRLLRIPYQAQADVIEGCAAHLRERRSVLVVGTMGTGKTLIGAAIPYVVERGRPYRALVMCPGHLVEKWVREVRTTVPEARVRVLKTVADVARLDLAAKPDVPEYHIISRDRAKLSYLRRPAVEWKRGLIGTAPDGERKMFRAAGWYCPDCGAVQVDPETGMPLGSGAFARPTRRNARCGVCGTPLWTADRKLRRYSPADFIKKRLKGYYRYLVADEVHELKGETAQGEAFGTLAGACGRTIALTGTLLGGYATNLFRIMFRLNPKAVLREGIGYRSQSSWASRYGVLERVYRKRDAERRKMSRGGYELLRVTEKPGVSPVVFPNHLLGSCAFLEIEDLGLDLPPYMERVEVLDMLPEQARAYGRLADALKDAVTGFGAGKRLLSTYLQVLLSYPDRPWGFEPVIHPETGDVVAVPEDLDQGLVYPKDDRLVRLVREANARGRRVFVYVVYTGVRDVAGRLAGILERAGIRTAVLRTGSPEPMAREGWIRDRVAEGVQCVIANADLVKTGLDLYEFPELVFYQTGYSIYTLRQAARRSWRIGQTQPVRVTFLAYRDTLQEAALRLIGAKLRASLAVEGKFTDEGLMAMCEGEDMALALAKALTEGMGGLETAEAIWRDMAAKSGWSNEEENSAAVVAAEAGALLALPPPRVLVVGVDIPMPKRGSRVGVGQVALDLGV